jgi:uncharacterized protein with HEPN domain
MDVKIRKNLLNEQLNVLRSARDILQESYSRVTPILNKEQKDLSPAEKESLEALTARFARLCDFLFQRVFRTIDQIELVAEEGSNIDRLNRMEKRGVILSAALWRTLRELRNQIAHEYLIESSDMVVQQSHAQTPELSATVDRVLIYIDKHQLA